MLAGHSDISADLERTRGTNSDGETRRNEERFALVYGLVESDSGDKKFGQKKSHSKNSSKTDLYDFMLPLNETSSVLYELYSQNQ